jgi:hypothetical protein
MGPPGSWIEEERLINYTVFFIVRPENPVCSGNHNGGEARFCAVLRITKEAAAASYFRSSFFGLKAYP